ncbi:hypothetical protein LIP70_14865, partial [Mediterraneibacter faecis]|uniref:hypothetical protein n=1 Tax=Mediterraneibacter faecis TaxID=592978 RepID=UPI001D00FE5A
KFIIPDTETINNLIYAILAGKKRMGNHPYGKNSEISVRNRKRNAGGRTDGKMPERAGRNVRI